ncbi:MAG: HEAT repeat domain-containing protein [Deltaproteobacteria bacterium]|nr:HEAT repeat domain-containing protein [Deltaproteobacteria bacterium]MBW2446955.1 HEAT repeat domain-containing protein [Deltaproteobacteria bacterium]
MSAEFEQRERESVRQDLASHDEEVRRLAVERLAVYASDDEGMASLMDCLGDPSWRVRKAAVERLSGMSEPWRAVDALIIALADGDNPGRRNAAVEVLIRAGSRVVPDLIGATQDADIDVRKLVVDALAGIADERATGRLVEMLVDADANVRGAAADALGGIEDGRIPPALLEVAVKPNEDQLVRFSALRALSRLEHSTPAQDLAGVLDDTVLGPAAFSVLGHSDDEQAIEFLLKGLLGSSRGGREAAMEALLRVLARLDGVRAGWLIERVSEAARSCDVLVADGTERIATADLSTRLVLVQFLGLLRSDEVVIPVLLAGRDEALAEVAIATLAAMGPLTEEALESGWESLPPESRELACQVLGRTRGASGEARLLVALDDSDPRLRTASAGALGRRRCADALPALVRRLEVTADLDDSAGDEELSGVTEALVALTRLEDGAHGSTTDQAVELLTARLDGVSESVRLAIATVLGRIGRDEDAELVTRMLRDESAAVRRAAVHALGRLDSESAAEPLRLALADESSTVRIAAARALGDSRQSGVVDDLSRLALDHDATVRAAALRALGAHASHGGRGVDIGVVIDVLTEALADEGVVVMAAVESLASFGGGAASRACLPLLQENDPELLIAAIGCVGKYGDAEALTELLPLVSHPHWSVRSESIGALSERGVVSAVPAILRRLETEQDDFVRDAILRALKRLEG